MTKTMNAESEERLFEIARSVPANEAAAGLLGKNGEEGKRGHLQEQDLVDLTSFSRQPNQLIPLLQHFQGQRGYISRAAVNQIADHLGVSKALTYGVASFYTQFRFTKPGDHQVRICMGTACHVQGGLSLSEEIQQIIGISPGEISPDQKFEFHEVACLGCCAQAPVVEIDGKIHGKVTRKTLKRVFREILDSDAKVAAGAATLTSKLTPQAAPTEGL